MGVGPVKMGAVRGGHLSGCALFAALKHKASKRRRSDEAPRKFVRQNLPDDSKGVLLQWAEEHLSHPYPTQKDKEELCEEANLTMAQLTNWFTNYRKRSWRKSR